MDFAASSLEWKLTSPKGFALLTASHLQRQICQLLDGLLVDEIPNIGASCVGVKPREVAVVAGVRGGKSLIAAAAILHWSQVVDCSMLGPGDIPRIPILSVKKDEAHVIFQHLLGRLRESAVFREVLIGEPKAEQCMLRHPSGRPIEVKIVAGARSGASLTARWMAGCVFDEFPRMHGSSDGSVINWDDSRGVVQHRLLPGAQALHIGSPWAPFGPAYEMVKRCFGHPSEEIVVVRAPSYELNQEWWTPERVERAKSLPTYRTDVLAEFASPEEMFFPMELLQRCTRTERLPEHGHEYVAMMDPATRGNGWTLLIGTREGKVRKVVRAKEWRGTETEPLSSRKVLAEIAEICAPYKITRIHSDQYMGDALADIAREFGLNVIQWRPSEGERVSYFMTLRRWMEESELEIPEEIVGDLVQVQKVPTTSGVSIRLPLTNDKRHCDYAPSLMLFAAQAVKDVRTVANNGVAHPGSVMVKMRQNAMKRYGKKGAFDW